MKNLNKINLGCGDDYKEGYVNVDIDDKNIYGVPTKVDTIHDLNVYPYPFPNSNFKEIFSKGLLGHIKDLDRHMKELKRISADGCIVIIQVPYFLSYYSASELAYHRFSLRSKELFWIIKRNGFELKKTRFIISYNGFLRFLNYLANINDFTQNVVERFPMIIPNAVQWEFIKEK